MLKVRTEENNCNQNFDHHGDNQRQSLVFDRGEFSRGLPKKSCAAEPKHSDLSRRRWHTPFPDRREQRQLIRDAKAGDERAKDKLLEAFHRLVLRIANEHSGPVFEDLVSAGFAGLWVAITRFNENRGNGLEAYAPSWIKKYIRDEIKKWRREGQSGETGQDRYVYSNPYAAADEIVAAVGGTEGDANLAILRLHAGHERYDTAESAFDEDGKYTGPGLDLTLHHRFDLSPQLRLHEIVCGNRPDNRLGLIDEFVNHNEAEARRHLDRVGRRQYALELVWRKIVVASFRNKQSRYLYRTDTDLKVRCQIAARINTPVFAKVLTFERPKTFEVSLAVQMEDKGRWLRRG
jgi:RNA polymerase sigma factor (sigma-70 family)